MKIIVGLGNIGPQYQDTRHNAGFIVVNEFVKQIAQEQNCEIEGAVNSKLKAFCAKTSYKGEDIFIAKPTTLMNLSGKSVAAILAFFKSEPTDLIVIYDDIDLALGKVRTREKGSAGTHNGMRSIIESIGSEDFTRIRIGIESRGKFAPAAQDISSFVLQKFTEEEREILEPAISEAVETLKTLIPEK